MDERHDWSAAGPAGSVLSARQPLPSLGDIADWPPEVRAIIQTVLPMASPVAVLVGREGRVLCNDAAREMFGDAFVGAQGKRIDAVLPIATDFYREAIDACYHGRSLRFRDEPIKLCRDGQWQTCWFNFSLTPILDGGGQTFGTLLIANETSSHMRTRKALNMAYQRMEMALEAGGIVGTWDLDVASRKIIIDGSLASQYGVSESDARDGILLEELFENLHADDRPRALATVNAAIATESDYRNRFRAITKDGELRWYAASGRPIRDDQNRLVQLAGIVIDVTSQTETIAALEKSNMRFDTLVEAIPQIVWSTDERGNHDYFNHRWSEFTGVDRKDVPPDHWTRLVHPEDWERVQKTWGECLATGKTYDIDYRFRRHDGAFRWLRVISMPMRDRNGQILRWYGTATDIDDAKQLDGQKELVARELDHRIKNLFALVNGLVGLSARQEPLLAPLADKLRSRLTALHKAHDLIRESAGLQAGSMTQLLRQLLAPYQTQQPDAITIIGLDILVKIGAVTSVALIFHELATNAAKYGALSHADGRLLITLDHDETWCNVHWTEHFNGAAPESAPTDGFGSRLLEALVEKQFHGKFTRSQTLDGLSVHVQLPASAFQDAAL